LEVLRSSVRLNPEQEEVKALIQAIEKEEDGVRSKEMQKGGLNG